ncbi:unnamed protein product, partial [Darwinula stevensoni]
MMNLSQTDNKEKLLCQMSLLGFLMLSPVLIASGGRNLFAMYAERSFLGNASAPYNKYEPTGMRDGCNIPDAWNNARAISQLQDVIVRSIRPYFTNVKAVAHIDHPDHNNRGDSAIWMGEEIFLDMLNVSISPRSPATIWMGEEIFLDMLNVSIVYKCTLRHTPMKSDTCNSSRAREALQPFVKEGTGLVAMQGGGNLGDLWKGPERLRHEFIAELPNLPFLLFPQSIFFEKEENINESRRAYSGARNFTLLTREMASLEFARSRFPAVRSALVPDMALLLGHRPRPVEPTWDVLWLRRTDKERLPQFEPLRVGWPLNVTVKIDDWLGEVEGLPDSDGGTLTSRAHLRTRDGFRFLARGKVIVTDRLHAHILSTLMSIPHVVLDSSYGKVKNFHNQWFTNICSAILKTLQPRCPPTPPPIPDSMMIESVAFLFLARSRFPAVRSALVPDMALLLGHRPRPVEPTWDVLWLRRTDKEGLPQFEPLRVGWPLKVTVKIDDWLGEVEGLPDYDGGTLTSRAHLRTRDAFRFLARGKVIITDRLHAHILSTLMSIPHVVLDNSYGKVKNFHNQ